MRWVGLLIAISLSACNAKKPIETPDEPTEKEEPNAKLSSFAPPTTREAVPNRVLDLRLKEPVGSFEIDNVQKPLVGFGVNLCQTGYYLQGFTRTDDGKLESAPGLLISRATIPTTRFVYRSANSGGKSIEMNFTEFSLDRVVGELAVNDEDGEPTLIYRVDGVPTTAGNVAGLGTQGCFTTGEFSISTKGQEISGPVTAIFDGNTFYMVIAQLTERHQVMWHIDLRPHQRKAGSLIRGDHARILESPQKYPFRTTFVTRRDDPNTEPPLTADEEIVTTGSVTAAWQTDTAEGPLKIEISDLELPQWDGPWPGETVTLRILTNFVTDPKGVRVPRPAKLP